MNRLGAVKATANSDWGADELRRWFADPELFGARRLLSDSSGLVEASQSGVKLTIRVESGGKPHFCSVRLPGLGERSRKVSGSCTCGAAGVCQHMVAGILTHAAKLRKTPVDRVLTEVLGTGIGTPPLDVSEQEPGAFAKELVTWLAMSPDRGAGAKGGSAHATMFLQSSDPESVMLDRVGVERISGGREQWMSLAEAAVDDTLSRMMQRSAAMLLAEGAGRKGERWGQGAAKACIELAEAGLLRVFGEERPLRPAMNGTGKLRWAIDGDKARLIVDLPSGTRKLVDAEPGLYVTAGGEIGVLDGAPTRILNWAMQAPEVPLGEESSFRAHVDRSAAASQYLPPLPRFATERAPVERTTPVVTLKGQGSTARLELYFDYGGVEVDEPGAGAEVRRFVDGRWLVASRDLAMETGCVERLKAAGLRQANFRKWSFDFPALFASSTSGQWLGLQKGLLRDLEFEDWRVLIEEDFGFRKDVVAGKASAEAEQRFNRKRKAA